MSFDIQTIAIWSGVILGIYSALLSTTLAIREWRKDERKLNVRCEYGSLQGGAFGPPKEVLTIRAVNTGHRPVEIVAAGWEFSDKHTGAAFMDVDGKVPFPKVIEPGASFSISNYLDSVQSTLEKHRQEHGAKSGYTRVFVRDSLNKYYRCKLPKIMLERKMTAMRALFQR